MPDWRCAPPAGRAGVAPKFPTAAAPRLSPYFLFPISPFLRAQRAYAGSVTVNVAPSPSRLTTPSVPPWPSVTMS